MQIKSVAECSKEIQDQLSLNAGQSIAECSKGIQDQLSLNAGQKYCRMLQGDSRPIIT